MLDSIVGLSASPVATLTAYGHALLRWVVAMNLWTGGLLAGAILLDRALAKRARASWRLALYAPVALRLLVPLSWKIALPHAPRVVTLLTPRPDGFLPPAYAPAHAPLFTWQAALVVAYVAVALVLAFVRVRASLHLRRETASARLVPGHAVPEGAPCPVLEHEDLGPMVVGTLRPRIVLPSMLLAPEQAGILTCVLGHEMAHVRRGDPWLMAAIQVFTVACWPVLPLWIAAQRVRTLVEMACDERALDDADESARLRYGHTLLDMAEWRTVIVSPVGAGELHFGSMLRARIEALADVRHWPRAVQAGLVALAVGGFAACSSVGAGPSTKSDATTAIAVEAQGWAPPPSGELTSYQDLKIYCGPLLFFEPRRPSWNEPRYLEPVPAGLPSAQVAFCTTPAVRDFVLAQAIATEGRNALGQIMKDEAAHYENVAYPSGHYETCPSGAPVPRVMQAPDTSYVPKWPEDWNDGAGWQCLKFGMDRPMLFQYELVSDGQHVKATAHAQRTNYLGQVVDVTLTLHADIILKDGDHVLNIAPNIEEIWQVLP